MHIQRIRYVTIEEYFADQIGWDCEYLQLSPGTLNFRTTVVSLPGIKLYWNVFRKRMKHYEVYNGSTLMFGAVLESDGLLTYRGRKFERDSAFVWQPGLEHEFVTGDSLRTLVVYVDAELVDQMGWILDRDPVKPVSRTSLKTLVEECRRVTDRSIAVFGSVIDSPEELSMRDRILVCLEAALEPWLGVPRDRRRWTMPSNNDFKLVKRAEALFEQHNLTKVPTVDVLAKELGVSRRTLYYAFRKSLHMSPYAYLRLVRLHRLRHRLLQGNESGTSVTNAAYELGFTHLGRLSEYYRKHFGESPRDTLKRN